MICKAVRNSDETDTYDPVVSISITLADGVVWSFEPHEIHNLLLRPQTDSNDGSPDAS